MTVTIPKYDAISIKLLNQEFQRYFHPTHQNAHCGQATRHLTVQAGAHGTRETRVHTSMSSLPIWASNPAARKDHGSDLTTKYQKQPQTQTPSGKTKYRSCPIRTSNVRRDLRTQQVHPVPSPNELHSVLFSDRPRRARSIEGTPNFNCYSSLFIASRGGL